MGEYRQAGRQVAATLHARCCHEAQLTPVRPQISSKLAGVGMVRPADARTCVVLEWVRG